MTDHRPAMTQRRRARWLVIMVTMLAGVIATVRLVATKQWQRWDFDAEWSHATIARAAPMLRALDAHRAVHGAYPDALTALVPETIDALPDPVGHPTGNGGTRWLYERLPDGAYELSVPCMHWVSSFDALVYRSSETYPAAWEQSIQCIPVDDWRYVVGKSQFMKRDDR